MAEPFDVAEPVSNFTRDAYDAAVERARDYIAAGDIFQVVPSQRWTYDFPLPPFALYRALRRTNPSPFMFHFDMGDFQIVGASPEILVRVFGDEVTIRPIAGTRPRGATPEEDRALEAELLADEKERAEHLMLLDLGRNDVGRVARMGTVRPTETLRGRALLPRHAHRLQRGGRALDGARRAVGAARRPAGGHRVGRAQGAGDADHRRAGAREARRLRRRLRLFHAANGDMDMCIALRTGVVKDGKLYVQAGGGVVHDSDPAGGVAGDGEQVPRPSHGGRRGGAVRAARQRLKAPVPFGSAAAPSASGSGRARS